MLSLITLSPPKDYTTGINASTHHSTSDGVTYQENFATAQMILPASKWFIGGSVLLANARVFMHSHRQDYKNKNCMQLEGT